MNLFISKLVRSVASYNKHNITTIPKSCFAMYYLPHSNNDVCDCLDVCKYSPPSSAIMNNFKRKKITTNNQYYQEYYEEKVA
jgi:hypothetical protein